MEILSGRALARFSPPRVAEKDMLPVPDRFHDGSLGIRRDMHYTLARPATLPESRSTFWNLPISVRVLPHADPSVPTEVRSNGHAVPCTIDRVTTKMHNIEVTDGTAGVGILEHPNAVQTALGVDMDMDVSTLKNSKLRRFLQGCGLASPSISLPTNADCNQPYLEALRGNLVPVGGARYVTVSEPVGFRFAQDSYVILAPDEGNHELVVDQQIDYPAVPAVGRQRMRATMTPEFFSFIASARTPAAQTRARLVQLVHGLGMNHFPYSSLGMSNVLLVTKEGIANPNPKFSEGGRDYEFMCHELIDKIGWLKFVEIAYGKRFVGSMTLSRTSHAHEVEVARALCGTEGAMGMGNLAQEIDVTGLERAQAA